MVIGNRRTVVLLVLVLPLVSTSLAGCGITPMPTEEVVTEEPEPTEPTVGPEAPVEPTCAPGAAPSCPMEGTPTWYAWPDQTLQIYYEDPGFHFSSREFILVGYAGQVKDVVSALSDKEYKGTKMPAIELRKEVILNHMPGLILSGKCEALAQQFPRLSTSESFVMSLYEALPNPELDLDQENLAAEVVARVDDLVESDANLSVVADFVWGTGSVDGSPWTAMESPWTAMGSPFDGLTPYRQASSEPGKAFCCQWAFQRGAGIGLHNNDCTRTVNYQGDRVRVGVFDTSPTTWSKGTHAVGSGESEIEITVTDWGGPYWEASKPIKAFDDENWGYGEAGARFIAGPPFPWLWPTNNHGLFVAGLVKAVAPLAEVYLYRVLDNRGAGDLFTLNLALNSFMSQVKDDRDSNRLDGAIINLSLGSPVRWVRQEGLFGSVMLKAEDEEPDSLRVLLAAAECLDIVVVAAAGNEGVWLDTPANIESTVGVGSSNSAASPSCFSNRGGLFFPVEAATGIHAPGGDGCDSGQEGASCVWALDECTDDCHHALISTVQKSGKFEESDGYAYGAGTSFSTSLVSGFLALGINDLVADGKKATADAVRSIVRNPMRMCASEYYKRVGSVLYTPAPGAALYIYIPHAFLGEPCPYDP